MNIPPSLIEAMLKRREPDHTPEQVKFLKESREAFQRKLDAWATMKFEELTRVTEEGRMPGHVALAVLAEAFRISEKVRELTEKKLGTGVSAVECQKAIYELIVVFTTSKEETIRDVRRMFPDED
jgi:tryptophanyl-tRNA synthetase